MFIREIPPEGAEVLHRFATQAVMVGRTAEADLYLGEPKLSRRHLTFRREGEGWLAEDQGSRNGTLLNGRPLLGVERLRPGDRLRLGDWVLVFEGEPHGTPGAIACEAETRGADEVPGGAAAGIELVGVSQAMAGVRELIADFAVTDLTVLLRGEPGTGKELAAALIHEQSARRTGPFVTVNCPAISKDLAESELFGIAKGTASGVDGRDGKILQARGGTLFLDEVGDLDIALQAKLLRFLENGTVDVVGVPTPVHADVRVVAATNRDLEAAADQGSFREDLLGRLAGAEIRLPPLSERREDIPVLARHFAELARPRPAGLEPDALSELAARHWPKNVRGLRRTIEVGAARAKGGAITLDHVGSSQAGHDPLIDLANRLIAGNGDFWAEVREPYLDRSRSKADTKSIVNRLDDAFDNWLKAAEVMLFTAEDSAKDKQTKHKKLLQFLRDNGLRPCDE